MLPTSCPRYQIPTAPSLQKLSCTYTVFVAEQGLSRAKKQGCVILFLYDIHQNLISIQLRYFLYNKIWYSRTGFYNVIQIRQTHTKNKQINIVKFKGKISQPSNKDIIYWMNQHIKQKFDISLADLVGSGLEQIKDRQDMMWGWSKISMSLKFRFYILNIIIN